MLKKNCRKKILTLCFLTFFLSLNGCWWASYLPGQKYLPLDPGLGVRHTPVYHQDGWIIARASLHNHTIISDGTSRPEDLIELARREGIAILAVTDHREGRIKLSNGIKIPVNGIEKIGYQKYFDTLLPLKEANQDLIILIGAEVNPYLYNIGRFPSFVILNQDSHFVVYNIKDPEVFEKMPAWREVSTKPIGYPGRAPYQDWVNYIVDHNGLVFVAHPASDQNVWVLTIRFYAEPPVQNLRLKNISGFSSLTESYGPEVAGPGGAWDSVLSEYLSGMRDRPIWTVGDCDYHGGNGTLTGCGNTLFYLRRFSEDDVYLAMREGRMVSFAGEMFQNSYIAEFSVSDGKAPQDLIMLGKEIRVADPPVIRFRLDHNIPGVKTILIRNGKVIRETEGSALEFIDREMFEKKMPAYYRVQVLGPPTIETTKSGPSQRVNIIFTNPIFVRL